MDMFMDTFKYYKKFFNVNRVLPSGPGDEKYVINDLGFRRRVLLSSEEYNARYEEYCKRSQEWWDHQHLIEKLLGEMPRVVKRYNGIL